MEQPKPSSVSTFLFGQPIDFVSPLSAEECALRLSNKSERGDSWLFSNRNKLKVTVQASGKGRYTFKLERDAGRNLNVEVEGQLIADGENRTQVVGRARISRVFFFLFAIIIPFQIIIFGSISPLLILILIPVLAGIIGWGFCIVERNKLERIVYNTLSDQLF